MPSFNNPPPLSFVDSRLDSRVVFVAGASSGIGRAAVRGSPPKGPPSWPPPGGSIACTRSSTRSAPMAAKPWPCPAT